MSNGGDILQLVDTTQPVEPVPIRTRRGIHTVTVDATAPQLLDFEQMLGDCHAFLVETEAALKSHDHVFGQATCF